MAKGLVAQWSGNTKPVMRDIGIVTCIYVNPALNRFWLIDYRLFAPAEDGATKLDHAQEMFDLAIQSKRLELHAVLMDIGYASRQFMLHLERNSKLYYCPVQANREVTNEGNNTSHSKQSRA